MKLYETWKKMAEMQQTPQQQVKYWNEYFAMETEIYKKILQNRDTKFQGKLEELAKEFDMDPVVFCGFMDGINTSLVNGYDVECLEETSDIVLDVDFEKLFYNMLEAKAKWLYTLPEWNDVLPLEKRQEITRAWRKSKQVINDQKIGRNDPCPCGSGLKYKTCCGKSA